MVQDVLESAPSNAEQSLASWAVLEGSSQAENGSLGMLDELRYSSDTPDALPPAQRPAVVSNVLNPLFLHSESQQSFPYSQYPPQETRDSEDEEDEDEVLASVVKPQKMTKSSSQFRSLTEIASQPTLFTPTMRLTQNNRPSKEELMNLYGRGNRGEEEESSSDSDTESESDAGAKAQTSHIPLSRRAGILP
jgi:hypothetical protein